MGHGVISAAEALQQGQHEKNQQRLEKLPAKQPQQKQGPHIDDIHHNQFHAVSVNFPFFLAWIAVSKYKINAAPNQFLIHIKKLPRPSLRFHYNAMMGERAIPCVKSDFQSVNFMGQSIAIYFGPFRQGQVPSREEA
ncbi:hypothetical protein SDC9_183284 [bioreactor metagenome]|uniref:Uncharacterized protein n=1 Tax=bioreactor metagenome TaxID=1076179 RepID=A0A645HBP1_9ZZZZ